MAAGVAAAAVLVAAAVAVALRDRGGSSPTGPAAGPATTTTEMPTTTTTTRRGGGGGGGGATGGGGGGGGGDGQPAGIEESALPQPGVLAAPTVWDPAALPRLGPPPVSPERRIRYVVVPHPDDEFSAWSLVGGQGDHYVVFVLLTRGEATRFCDGHGLQAVYGERQPPATWPWPGEGTPGCKALRVDSFNAFLDKMAELDPSLDVPGPPVRLGSPVGPFDLAVGARTARAVFDLGDGRLTPAAVTAAVQAVRAVRDRLPVTAEDDVVGAAYRNGHYPDAVVYDHPDHLAVHRALHETDQGTPGPQWGRTVATDPERAETFVVPDALYCQVLCVSPYNSKGAWRTGALQWAYGWLADDYWSADPTKGASIFSQSQDFWRRF